MKQAVVYLADVARLEWALNVALHAEERLPMTADALRQIPGEQVACLTFQCHPALTLLCSLWPIDQIWRAHQADADLTAAIDLCAGGVRLEIFRGADAVGFRTLAPALYAFRAALATGHPLGTAVETALAVAEDFHVTRALADLLADGLVIGLTLRHDTREYRLCNPM